MTSVPTDRRTFLKVGTAGTLLAAGLAGNTPGADVPAVRTAQELLRSQPPPRDKPPSRKLALVTTAYYYLSHAYHICGRFLDGYLRDGKFHHSDFAMAGMYVAQQKEQDLSRVLAKKHGIPLHDSVAGALTLGTDKLAVDGVLLIGEHGDYPYNNKAQKLYPRYELFQEIVKVFKASGRTVGVFCDKHLSYSHSQAEEMVQTAARMQFPLMAGSSLPITWRRPELELPLGSQIGEALVASRGELEIFGIHALEALQCMVERRFAPNAQKPPRQGVKAVTCLEGDDVWKAGDEGKWSWELLEHALSRSDSLNVGNLRENCLQFVPPAGRPTFPKGPVAFLVEYLDGLKATVLLLNGHVDDTTFAARVEGEKEPVSTLFYLPPPPGASFLQALTVKLEDFFAKGEAPSPVQRTLLTGGILDYVLESRIREHQRLETPRLHMTYALRADSSFLRGSWKREA